MTDYQFIAQAGNGNPISPHTVIFPILKEVSPNENRLVGTGFFITKFGHFVTAKHVIQDVLDTATGQQHSPIHALHFVQGFEVLVRHITKVSVHNSVDVAVGKMDYHEINTTGKPLTNRVPRFTTEIPRVGSPVCTYAYPESDATFVKGGGSRFVANFYVGEFLEHSSQPRDSVNVTWPHFVTSIIVKGRASGGPVFDERGRVFGINCIGGAGLLEDRSYMGRAYDLLQLDVPEFPGEHTPTVHDLAVHGAITFDPAITIGPTVSGRFRRPPVIR
jgi:hypothetical protein